MASKQNGAAGTISLPKGGGALQGLGEKFSPDLQTGTGNFSVPIALPSGRNGFHPQLTLGYSTGAGNGHFGLGWNLSIPGVRRKTSKGIPQYNAADTFVLSGAEDLVPISGDVRGVVSYAPRTEGLFARIQHVRKSGEDYWQVDSRDGLKNFYGKAPFGSDAPTVRNPDDPNQIVSWSLAFTEDTHGNRIEYLYERDGVPTEGPHHWDQLRLKEVRYVEYDDTSSTPVLSRFLVHVRFRYEVRPDPFSEYRAGFEIRTTRRCTQIDILTDDRGVEHLSRSYHLVYLDQRSDRSERLPLNGVSLLSLFHVEGHKLGESPEPMPPLEFGYTTFEPARRHFSRVTGPDLPAVSLANPDLELVDLFGDGLPDILQISGNVRYWRNLGMGYFLDSGDPNL